MKKGTISISLSAGAGIGLIAAIYFYFLIFAQFAYLALLREVAGGLEQQKLMLGVMTFAGLAGSGSAAYFMPRWGAWRMLGLGLISAALAATLAPLSSWAVCHGPVSLGTGLGMGWATVSLITLLPQLLGHSGWGWKIGLGTGLAYWLCNLPIVFQTSATQQSFAAASLILASALALTLPLRDRATTISARPQTALPLWLGVISFMVLVWYDSAAFYIIQQTDGLKAGTWGDTSHLVRNGLMHFVSALAAGWALDRAQFRRLLPIALATLILAGLLINQTSTRTLGGCLYPVGVSLYSVCLLAYPAYLSGAPHAAGRGRHAALIFALAGWLASAMGIGMAEQLHRIPLGFVLATLALMLPIHAWGWLQRHQIEMSVLGVMALLAWLGLKWNDPARTSGKLSTAAFGRQVYISEGCIHCHSQFVRAGTWDEVAWGPAEKLDIVISDSPPLLGNRRQGPDLMHIGNRRSAKWLQQHFLDPQSLSKGSVMPSYAHLFTDDRGPALIAYLRTLGQGTLLTRQKTIHAWSPKVLATDTNQSGSTSREVGRALFARHCSMCHGKEGDGQGVFSQIFPHPMGPLSTRRFLRIPSNANPEVMRVGLARIIKFGIAGTDMPGHEYLSDAAIVSLVSFVAE